MQIIDLSATTGVCRSIAGPGTDETCLGFNVDIARVSTEGVTWNGLPRAGERVFFATAKVRKRADQSYRFAVAGDIGAGSPEQRTVAASLSAL